LMKFLQQAGAMPVTVAPYVYADKSADDAVRALLGRLAEGAVDAIAFTSTPQVIRLFAVADAATVQAALSRTLVAAVGPVVAETLAARGIQAQITPTESFFLKPLTTALEAALGAKREA
jgi:uroporphyrinogen-III synthase